MWENKSKSLINQCLFYVRYNVMQFDSGKKFFISTAKYSKASETKAVDCNFAVWKDWFNS